MMTFFARSFGTFAASFLAICLSTGSFPARAADDSLAEVRRNMLDFKNAATDLFPFAFRENPNGQNLGKADQERTLKLLEKLNGHVGVAKHQGMFAANPSAEITFDVLQSTLSESLASYKIGRTELSRDLLRAGFYTCLNCHASGLTKQQFSFGDTEKLTNEFSSPIKKANIFFVFRDFSKVTQITDSAFSKENPLQLSQVEQRELLQLFLSAAVLQDASPLEMSQRLEKYLSTINKNAVLRSEIAVWVEALHAWNQELKSQKSNSAISMTAAEKLVAQEKGQPLLASRDRFIEHLRAKQMLMQMATYKKLPDSDMARIVHLLGLIYRAHDNTLFLGLGDAHFSSCIRRFSHSPQAEQCFDSLRASIEQASTGSSGVHMAPEDINYLNKMKALAYPKAKKVK